MKRFAGLVLAVGIALGATGTAQAGWRGIIGWGPYLYYGWPYPTPSFDLPGSFSYAPAEYAPPPECRWVRVEAWRHGHRIWRRVRRCW
jgi:hypothetical protein